MRRRKKFNTHERQWMGKSAKIRKSKKESKQHQGRKRARKQRKESWNKNANIKSHRGAHCVLMGDCSRSAHGSKNLGSIDKRPGVKRAFMLRLNVPKSFYIWFFVFFLCLSEGHKKLYLRRKWKPRFFCGFTQKLFKAILRSFSLFRLEFIFRC